VTKELQQALAVWRETRTAAAADAIDALTRTALAGWRPPEFRLNQPFHAAWLVAAKDVAQRGWAAEALATKLPGASTAWDATTQRMVQNAAALRARLVALAKHGPDPRIARAVIRVFATPPRFLSYGDTREACERALIASGDERSDRELAELAVTADAELAALVARVLAKRPRGRKPTAKEAARWKSAPRDDAALWAELAAHPERDDVRLVLADMLQARGDPRGEYIALQLADRDHDRQDALLAQHGLVWLGGMGRFAYRAVFRRGFVERLELGGRKRMSKQGWAACVTDSALATIVELLPGRTGGDIYHARFITSPVMTALRRIEVLDEPSLAALETTTAKLEHVTYQIAVKRGAYLDALPRVLAACERIGVTSLGLDASGFALLAKTDLFTRLAAITLGGEPRDVLPLWPRIPRGVTLAIARTASLPGLVQKPLAWVGSLSLAADGKATVARASGDWLAQSVPLPALAKLATRLEITDVSPAVAKQLATAAKKTKLALVVTPAARRVGYLTIK